MTGKEFNTIILETRKCYGEAHNRIDIEDYAYILTKQLKAIGRTELAKDVWEFYCEMEDMTDEEVAKIDGGLYEKRRVI